MTQNSMILPCKTLKNPIFFWRASRADIPKDLGRPLLTLQNPPNLAGRPLLRGGPYFQ